MISPIYFFTRSGCVWCKKMQPSIDDINKTLSEEQRIQIVNTDEQKHQELYDSIVKRHNLQRIKPMLYNSNIGTYLIGFQNKINIQQFLKGQTVKTQKPLTAMPQFMVTKSSKKDFDNWKKDVILWYEINKNQLPPNVVDKEKVIDMVYNQFMAHRTKPLTIEERLTKLEENSHEPQNYREECEKMNKEIKILKKQIKILKKKLGK